MQYKCETCHDTGDKDKDSGELGYLNCPDCDAPHQRASLNKWLMKQPALSAFDAAWAIHQRALAMAPKQEAPRQLPYAWVNAGTERQQTEYATLSVGPENPWMDSANAFPVYAAPAAANGALTDEQIMRIACDMKQRNANVWPGDVAFARAILAAAGPDAALIKALEKAEKKFLELEHMLGGGDDEVSVEVEILTIRAALSGAKGN